MLPDTSKAAMTIGILFVYYLSIVRSLSLLAGSMLLVLFLGVTKCITLDQAQRSIDGRVLLAIGVSISFGVAIQTTVIDLAVNAMISLAGENLYLNLLILYVSTVLATELITNNAAAVLMFPFSSDNECQLGCKFATFRDHNNVWRVIKFYDPMGYQTNLAVQGAGGYTIKDFFRVGFGLSLIVGIIVISVVPLVWPFN